MLNICWILSCICSKLIKKTPGQFSFKLVFLFIDLILHFQCSSRRWNSIYYFVLDRFSVTPHLIKVICIRWYVFCNTSKYVQKRKKKKDNICCAICMPQTIPEYFKSIFWSTERYMSKTKLKTSVLQRRFSINSDLFC